VAIPAAAIAVPEQAALAAHMVDRMDDLFGVTGAEPAILEIYTLVEARSTLISYLAS
jgi:hypothetical protein